MADLPSSSRTHSVSHSTTVVFKSSRNSSAASSEHARLVDDEEGDCDEVVLLDAQGQCEAAYEDPTHAQDEINSQGDTGSTKFKRGDGPHIVAEKALAHILRRKAQTGPETEGCGEYERIASTEASLRHSATSEVQPSEEGTHSHSFEPSDNRLSYASSHRTWFERRSGRWCLLTVIVVIFVAAIVAPVITVLQSQKPTAVTPVPQPPWLPWRNRTDDNGLPRILLWNTLAQRKRSLSQRIGAAAWNTTMQCESYAADEGCEVTNNRHLLERSDAIVFYAESLNRHDMPGSRAAPQMWVFWARSHLPPMDTAEWHLNSSLSLPQVAHLFNWTTGHREDSDVVIPYGDVRCDSSFGKRHSRRSRQQPRREAAWLVDDCEWNRFKTEASNASANDEGIIHIRLFPSCGASDCGTPSECVRYIARRYDFIVVSLEPICFLSADELIYEAFNYDVVPVVLTPPGATLSLPDHSVVSSAELYGERELAKYLRSLLDDPKKYESYFAWKERCSVVVLSDLLCPLCHALRETPVHRRTHSDVLEWWTRRTNCQGEPLFGLESGFIQVF